MKLEVPRRRSDTISEYFFRKKQYRAFVDALRRVSHHDRDAGQEDVRRSS